MTKEDYNNIPVFYCKRCNSLNIKSDGSGVVIDYCDDCSSTSIGITKINTWLEKEENKIK